MWGAREGLGWGGGCCSAIVQGGGWRTMGRGVLKAAGCYTPSTVHHTPLLRTSPCILLLLTPALLLLLQLPSPARVGDVQNILGVLFSGTVFVVSPTCCGCCCW
jgi:hypothetical protein